MLLRGTRVVDRSERSTKFRGLEEVQHDVTYGAARGGRRRVVAAVELAFSALAMDIAPLRPLIVEFLVEMVPAGFRVLSFLFFENNILHFKFFILRYVFIFYFSFVIHFFILFLRALFFLSCIPVKNKKCF